jgi:hypothetical protein
MLKSLSLCLYSSNLGTFWLKIEQFWPFEEISIFSNGGHLGYRTALTENFCLFWPIMQIRKKGGWNLKKIFSETTEPISTKLCWNDPWVVPFQNCVRQCRPVSKSNGGHHGYRTVLTDTILKGDHPRIISAKLGWDWLRAF